VIERLIWTFGRLLDGLGCAMRPPWAAWWGPRSSRLRASNVLRTGLRTIPPIKGFHTGSSTRSRPAKWGLKDSNLSLYLSLRYGPWWGFCWPGGARPASARPRAGFWRLLGVLGQTKRLHEHMFVYRLLVQGWAYIGAPGAAYALQGPRAVTCRPFYGVTRRYLGLSRAPHSTFPV
jgi:hypothetical protein